MAMQQLWQGQKWPCLLHRSFEYVYPMVHPVEAHFDVKRNPTIPNQVPLYEV